MSSTPDRYARATLPIPDRPVLGLTTYDAKDPDTAYRWRRHSAGHIPVRGFDTVRTEATK